ncbi:NYN domain-containing protein [Brevibacterium litoralis]|uniref:NYN domain-containing protein n=1 Tax=Brevibacterium litoralis TaxID=3138935 RepID=UPI0032EDB085
MTFHQQSAVFIDAGYLLAVGAAKTTGTSLRSAVEVDQPALIDGIVRATREDSGLDPLRVYWCDASYNQVMTDEHKRIALLPDVKVRLGRTGYNGNQKGVDLRIGLDLVEIARHRAARIAYVVTGDDDLAEAVIAAQDLGMKVVLVALKDPHRRHGAHSVASHLAYEVDRILTLPDSLVEQVFSPRSRPQAPAVEDTGSDGTATESADPAAEAPSTSPGPPAPGAPAANPGEPTPGHRADDHHGHGHHGVPSPAEVAAKIAGRGHTTVTGTGNGQPNGNGSGPSSSSPGHPSVSEHPVHSTRTGDHEAARRENVLDKVAGVAESVARSWYATCTMTELSEALEGRPEIPVEIDQTLLRDSGALIGEDLLDRQWIRRHLRAAFWDELDRLH